MPEVKYTPLALALVSGMKTRQVELNPVSISLDRDPRQNYHGREIIVTAKGNCFPSPKRRRIKDRK